MKGQLGDAMAPAPERAQSRLAIAVASLVGVALAGGCGGGDGGDALPAGKADAALPDGAPVDAGGEPEPFGTITGACGVLDVELTDVAPSTFVSHLSFPRLFDPGDPSDLDRVAPGTRTILTTDNAGGSSRLSEGFVYEVLHRCEAAELTHTESDIEYDPDGAKTDLRVSIADIGIGVSVARAVKYPFGTALPSADAEELVEGKLADILESSANVEPEQAWQKQILGLMAYDQQHADEIRQALDATDAELRADTVVWVIVTDGRDEFIYCDGPCD